MELHLYTDASFWLGKGVGKAAMIIKRDGRKKIMFQESYKIKAKNPIEAEAIAFNGALLYIIDKQNKNELEKGIRIVSFSDCKKMIINLYQEKNKQGINKVLWESILKNIEKIKQDNKYYLKWIPRESNEKTDELTRKTIEE